MIRRSFPGFAIAALLAVLAAGTILSSPDALRAQRVSGTVTGSDGGHPLEGVMVRLLDDDGEEAAGTFTNARGRFSLRVERPGRYRLQAERIGYSAHRGEPFRLVLGGDLERDIRLRTEGVRLSDLSVTSERQCSISPDKARGTRRLWSEARLALETARWSADRGEVEIRSRNVRRRLDERFRVERQLDSSLGYGMGISPYASVPAEDLARRGYVDARGDSLDYYAPDADVLLSDSFQRTHCFWVTRDEAPQSGWVGLAFRPTEEREVPEIEGVLWLDEGTAALQRLEFRYVNLNLATSYHRAGGEVDFFRLPSGPWIVRGWTIRMPLIEKEDLRITTYNRSGGVTAIHREDVEVAGYDEQSGQVIHIARDDRVLYDFERATVAGVAWDSVRSRPLEGARVELAGTGRVDTTDAQGRFRFPGVSRGTYRITLAHPFLAELGLGAREATVQAEPGELARARLSLPGAGRLAAELCPEAEEGTGVVMGRVIREGDGEAVSGARVAAAWPSSGADAGERTSWVHREVRTDGDGRYRICGVEPDGELALRAEAEGAAGSVTRIELASPTVETAELELGEGGAADRMASLVRQQGFGPGVAGDGEGGGPPGHVIGTVRASDDERPLAAAEVRLGEDRTVSTDSAGRFRVEGVEAGTHRVRVSYLGFASQEALVRVAPGDTMETTFLMQTEPVPLPELAVQVEGEPATAKMAGFRERRARGMGHYISREELEEIPGNDISDAFRGVPGIRVMPCPNSGGDCIATTRSRQSRLTTVTPSETRGISDPAAQDDRLPEGVEIPNADSVPQGRRCGIAYFVDGAPVNMVIENPDNPNSAVPMLDQVPKNDVQAIEVYTGPAQIPVQFRRGASGCAKVAIVIWTRTGGRAGAGRR